MCSDAPNGWSALVRTIVTIFVLFLLAPFGALAFVLGAFGISAYLNDRRSEESSLAKAYEEAFRASDLVRIRSGRMTAPGRDVSFIATITTPAGFGDRSGRLLAAQYGEAECRALLAILAARCTVLEAVGDDRTVTMRLELVQRQDAGKPGMWTRFFTARDMIEVRYNESPWKIASDGRVQVYKSIADGCRQQGIVAGACDLASLAVQTIAYADKQGGLATKTTAQTVLAVRRDLDTEEFVSLRRGRG